MTWVKNVYWYLDYYNCSLVTRNRKWFNTVVPQFQKIWDTILTERETGYDHRKPKKKNSSSNIKNTSKSNTITCKLNLKSNNNNSDGNNSDNDSNNSTNIKKSISKI